MVKLVAFLKRKATMTRDEFYDHWENHHAPLIANTPELARTALAGALEFDPEWIGIADQHTGFDWREIV